MTCDPVGYPRETSQPGLFPCCLLSLGQGMMVAAITRPPRTAAHEAAPPRRGGRGTMGPTITERPERPRTGENDRTPPASTGLLPLAPPSRRTLLLGVGTLGAGLALGTGTALAERPKLRSGS